MHFFDVRFIRDEHEMLWTASKCLDLRRFALQDSGDLSDIYEPLKQVLQWMIDGGVPNVPPVDDLYA